MMDEQDRRSEVGQDGRKGQQGGKYFLILLGMVLLTFTAYTIVDKNYERMYALAYSLSGDEPAFYHLGELVVNPAGTNGQRYLLVEISLEMTNREHIERVEHRSRQIKHEINELLSSRTVDQLNRFEEREQMRADLITLINRVVGMDSVRNLYYTRYVMQ